MGNQAGQSSNTQAVSNKPNDNPQEKVVANHDQQATKNCNVLGWRKVNIESYEPTDIEINNKAICALADLPKYGGIATFGMF